MRPPIVNLQICDLTPKDRPSLLELLRDVAIFEPHEIRVAAELIAETLGGSRDYLIHVARGAGASPASPGRGQVVGYICHGHNPVTDAIYDLYWIAVDPRVQGRGIGGRLIAYAEERARSLNGRGMVIETSNRPAYAAARRLYERCGYRMTAEIADFYKPGDARLFYVKLFTP